MTRPAKCTKEHEQISVTDCPLLVSLFETQKPQSHRRQRHTAPRLKIRPMPNEQPHRRHNDHVKSGNESSLACPCFLIGNTGLLQQRTQKQKHTRAQAGLDPVHRTKSLNRFSLVPNEENHRQANRPKRVAGAVEGVRPKVFASQFLRDKTESPDRARK